MQPTTIHHYTRTRKKKYTFIVSKIPIRQGVIRSVHRADGQEKK